MKTSRHIAIICLGWALLSSSVDAAAQLPSTGAPIPSCPPGQVISLFSDSYADVPVNTFLTPWSMPAFSNVFDFAAGGNNYKYYTSVGFFGIEFAGANTINASGMTSFHFDMWVPPANVTAFTVSLVDFGPNNVFGGGDDSESIITIPCLGAGEWHSYEIFLSDFRDLNARNNLAQIVISATPYSTSFMAIDNIFFNTCANQPFPTSPAPDPVLPQPDVISLYSDVYTDVPVNTFLAVWSQPAAPPNITLVDTQVGGNPIKFYQNVSFLGVEFVGGNIIDASSLNYVRMDVWTANMHTFRVKLVDFGPNLVFGGGDDSEHEIEFCDFPQESWVQLAIPLSDFITLNSTAHLAQIVLSGSPINVGRFAADNIYFSTTNAPLPVELIDYSAELQNDGTALLEWSTASEVNSSHFEIEHTQDGVHFDRLGVVSSAGFSSSERHYSFKHDNMPSGDNYYRLKQVDFDGAYEYLGTRYLNSAKPSQSPRIYPNPAQDIIYLQDLKEGSQVRIFDMRGAELVSELFTGLSSGPSSLAIDLPAGIYAISIESEHGLHREQLLIR